MADAILTAAYLREVLSYDPGTGLFKWLKKLNRKGRIGDVAGHFCKRKGYALIYIDGQRYRAHRLAWLYVTGDWPALVIDHMDRNPANNAWANLRLATAVENGRNRNPAKSSKSGVVGVTWCAVRQKWRGVLTLGYFADKDDAVKARDSAAKAVFGEFAPKIN